MQRIDIFCPLPAIRQCQSGSILLEFALVVWFLTFLLLSAFDFGIIFRDYFVLSQVTYDSARTASMVGGLVGSAEVTSIPTEEEKLECAATIKDPSILSPKPCALISAYFRTMAMLRFSGYDLADTRIYLAYDGAGKISVAISKRFDAFFPPYRLIPLRATTVMPYFGGV